MAKAGRIGFALTLSAAFCFIAISTAQADPLQASQAAKYLPNAVKAVSIPIWKITQDGTVHSVAWQDAVNPRFAVFDSGTPGDETDDVVLDKETGLVWERYPSTTTYDWIDAIREGYIKYWGGRMGWRLPTIEEIASLLVPSNPSKLPIGHPFLNVQTVDQDVYWSSTTNLESDVSDLAWCANLEVGIPAVANKLSDLRVWCVRGGQGHDAY